MAQSMYEWSAGGAVENFPSPVIHHAESGFYYRVYREGAGAVQEEYRIGRNGEKTHRLVRDMDWVVGSGSAARTYLTVVNDRYLQLPITWYTQERKWDFSPGYEVFNARFNREVPDRCMACHNSYPETVEFVAGKYDTVPAGIGCERCHGPGSVHVEARLIDEEADGEIDYTIVNPADLPLDRQLDVCQQCHLHGDVSLLRAGKDPFGFRPSQSLADHVALYSKPETGDGTVSVISHADRMKRSACFLETQGSDEPMNCVTCHNPHEGFREAGPAYFNETCQTCHAPDALLTQVPAAAKANHGPEANCISCHMPKVEAEDAPHSSFTDHFVRVVQQEVQAPRLDAESSARLVAYFERDQQADGYEALAYAVQARRSNDPTLQNQAADRLAGVPENDEAYGEARYLLGLTRMDQGRVSEAIPALEAAVQVDAGKPERLNALAQAYESAGRAPAQTENLYRRALSLSPGEAKIRTNMGRFFESQGRLDEARAAYEQAIAEWPWLPEAHYNLATLQLRQGDTAAAEETYRKALELDPLYTRAWSNLGILYASTNRASQAREAFERAVDAAPNDASALGNLGAFYLNAGRFQDAIRLLERAVENDPAYIDGHVNLALAYLQVGQDAKARQQVQQALRLDPSNAKARQIAAAL
ncbi:MAG: tetratricopeptide repeat protein [Bacteroidota bacterium]